MYSQASQKKTTKWNKSEKNTKQNKKNIKKTKLKQWFCLNRLTEPLEAPPRQRAAAALRDRGEERRPQLVEGLGGRVPTRREERGETVGTHRRGKNLGIVFWGIAKRTTKVTKVFGCCLVVCLKMSRVWLLYVSISKCSVVFCCALNNNHCLLVMSHEVLALLDPCFHCLSSRKLYLLESFVLQYSLSATTTIVQN